MHIIVDKKSKLIGSLILVGLEVLVGILLIFVPAEDIINVCLKIIGMVLIAVNLSHAFILYRMMLVDKRYELDFISSLISIGLGIVLLFAPGLVLSIILGCWFIIMPIIRICIHTNHKEQFKKEIPYLAVGALMVLFSVGFVLDVFVKVIGAVIILIAICQIITAIKKYKDDNNTHNNNYSNDKNDNIIDAEVRDL